MVYLDLGKTRIARMNADKKETRIREIRVHPRPKVSCDQDRAMGYRLPRMRLKAYHVYNPMVIFGSMGRACQLSNQTLLAL